jgi:hypothetical protein
MASCKKHSPPLAGGVKGGGKITKKITPTCILPHPRQKDGGIFDKGEEVIPQPTMIPPSKLKDVQWWLIIW